MPNPTDLSGFAASGSPADASDQEQSVLATIIRAPASWTDSMEIAIDAMGAAFTLTVVAGHWAPRGMSMPTAGARCIAHLDELKGDAWVSVWEGGQPASGIVTGTGNPGASGGTDGQFYLDTTSLKLWGPKANGAWPSSAVGKLTTAD